MGEPASRELAKDIRKAVAALRESKTNHRKHGVSWNGGQHGKRQYVRV